MQFILAYKSHDCVKHRLRRYAPQRIGELCASVTLRRNVRNGSAMALHEPVARIEALCRNG
jgi:hypothetical protein